MENGFFIERHCAITLPESVAGLLKDAGRDCERRGASKGMMVADSEEKAIRVTVGLWVSNPLFCVLRFGFGLYCACPI